MRYFPMNINIQIGYREKNLNLFESFYILTFIMTIYEPKWRDNQTNSVGF